MNSVVIQAGGRSSRMGRDKGLIPLGGRPMLAHVLDRVAGLADEVLITTNNPAAYRPFGLPLASDADPGAGALPGLLTALQAAGGDLVLVVACDMPFLNRDLLAHQLSLAGAADVVVPRWDGRFQTMHAVYRRETCRTAVRDALDAGETRMISFYPALNVHAIEVDVVRQFDPTGLTFFNANTPAELAEAERRLAAHS